MNLKNAEIIFEIPGVIGKRLDITEKTEIVHLTIEPGKSIPPHALPILVKFYIISGTGLMTVNGVEATVEQGDLHVCQPELERSWTNKGEEPLTVLVIKEL